MLRATTACIFSSFIWPAGSAPAAIARLLFEPPELFSNHWKNLVNRDFPTFSRTGLFLLLTLSLLIFSLLDFSSLTLPTCACPSLHIVGSLTSKLPSKICFNPNLRRLDFFYKGKSTEYQHQNHQTNPNIDQYPSKLPFGGFLKWWCPQNHLKGYSTKTIQLLGTPICGTPQLNATEYPSTHPTYPRSTCITTVAQVSQRPVDVDPEPPALRLLGSEQTAVPQLPEVTPSPGAKPCGANSARPISP